MSPRRLLAPTFLVATLAAGLTQGRPEMNRDAAKDFQKADAQLNNSRSP